MANLSGQSESMLVRSEHLDKLLLLAGEVIVASSGQEMTYRKLQSIRDKRQVLDGDAVDEAKDLATTTSIISSQLHHLVQAIRTVSLKDFGFRARRLVRDVARKTGKQVYFEFIGEDTTVDKAIIEKLYDPISHQLRNAVDHGIEDSLTREKAGKPLEGKVILRAYNTERETFIEIEDDGRGVNLEAIRQKGIKSGRMDADAHFDEDVALSLMCMPGVSTAETVSQTSGRGVGMDVVANHIAELGGAISFKTEAGKGSIFTIQVPLVSAVNIMDALVVRAGNYDIAFPINNVVSTAAVPREEVHSTLGKGKSITYLGNLLPLHDLSVILDGTPINGKAEAESVLIVEHKNDQVAFSVSEFLSPQKLVIIPFEGQFQITGLAGSTVLSGKQVGFIADVPAVINLAKGRKQASAASLRAKGGSNGTAKAEQASVAEVPGEETPQDLAASPPPADGQEAGAQTDEAPSAEIAREFLAEIERLAHSLNECVFQLESNGEDQNLLNNAFRLFHTLKGNLIMMGLTKGGETVHSVESVLDRARSGELKMMPEVMDILMDGVSYVEDVVRMGKSGALEDKAGTAIIEHASTLLPEAPVSPKDAPDVVNGEIRLSHEACYRALNYRKQQVPLYQCYIEFNAGRQPAFLVACLMYKRICEVGDVLATLPSLPDVEKGLMDGKFKLLFASANDPEEMETALRDLLTAHYGALTVTVRRYK